MRLLPYIEQSSLYAQIDLNVVPATQLNVIRQRIAIYLCPSEVRDEIRDQGGTPPKLDLSATIMESTSARGLYSIPSPAAAATVRFRSTQRRAPETFPTG